MPLGKRRSLVDSEHVLVLKGLLLLAVIGFAFFAAWRYDLLFRVWRDDQTGISVAITVVFLVAAGHGSVCLLRLSCALNRLADVQRRVAAGDSVSDHALPEGCVSRYIRASLGATRTIDRRLLLETFEADLKQGHLFGRFVSDLLLSLGLLGIVIGLLAMLGPIGGLGDRGGIGTVPGAISGGMRVALYTTLAALIGGMLLKIQGFLLDGAVDELARRTTRLIQSHPQP